MAATAVINPAVEPPRRALLTEADLEMLEQSGISRDLARAAHLYRVDDEAGRALVGRDGFKGNFSGICFPYFLPGSQGTVTHRLRRDYPDLRLDIFTSEPTYECKYVGPPDRGNFPYFPPGVDPQWLQDPMIPIIFTEGEKKALSLWRLAWPEFRDAAETPAFLPIGIPGVWGWSGRVQTQVNPDGSHSSVKGPLPQINNHSVLYAGRTTLICYDADVHTNSKVRIARERFAQQLAAWGATVRYVDVPADCAAKGIDDLVATWGTERTYEHILKNSYPSPSSPKPSTELALGSPYEVETLPDFSSEPDEPVDYIVHNLLSPGHLYLFTGPAGHGKTTVVSSLAYELSVGGNFLGLSCRQLPVLYLDRQNPKSVVRQRFERMGIVTNTNFHLWGGWLKGDVPDIYDPRIIGWIERAGGNCAVVIDSMKSFFSGDENSAKEVSEFFNYLRTLANLGASILMLHHIGKSDTSQDFRGSSDIAASIDVGFKVMNSGGNVLRDLTLTTWKNRPGINGTAIIHYQNGHLLADWKKEAIKENDTDRLTELLRNNSQVNQKTFLKKAGALGITNANAREFLNTGVITKIIGHQKGPNNADIYWLASTDSDETGWYQ